MLHSSRYKSTKKVLTVLVQVDWCNLSNFLKVPITYFYEDYADSQLTANSTEDLNYSFLIKTFGRLSENQKSKIIQILKNTGNLKETG